MSARNSEGSCLSRIRARLQNSSRAEERVGRFVLEGPERARNMSITEIAEACETSAATVSRFCKAVGYEGFREFQLDLAAALVRSERVSLDDFDETASPGTLLRRVFECNRVSLTDTERVLEPGTVLEVARAVRRAGRVVFIGIGGSGLVARDGAQRFLSLGRRATAVTDPYEQVFVSASVEEGEVVVCISHTGQTEQVVEAAAQARERGATTVALTNYPQSPLAQTCEHALITAFREHRINAAVSSSRIAQLCVIDALYFIVGSWEKEEATKLADEAEERVSRMLRPGSERDRKKS